MVFDLHLMDVVFALGGGGDGELFRMLAGLTQHDLSRHCERYHPFRHRRGTDQILRPFSRNGSHDP